MAPFPGKIGSFRIISAITQALIYKVTCGPNINGIGVKGGTDDKFRRSVVPGADIGDIGLRFTYEKYFFTVFWRSQNHKATHDE